MRGIGARVPHDTSVRPSVQQVTQRDLTQRLSIAQRQMDEHPPLAITASQPTTDSAEGATGEFAPLRRPPGDELANRASTPAHLRASPPAAPFSQHPPPQLPVPRHQPPRRRLPRRPTGRSSAALHCLPQREWPLLCGVCVCVCVCVRVCVRACVCARVHVFERVCARSCVRSCARASVCVVRACLRACLRACVRACERGASVRVVRACACARASDCARASREQRQLHRETCVRAPGHTRSAICHARRVKPVLLPALDVEDAPNGMAPEAAPTACECVRARVRKRIFMPQTHPDMCV